MIDHSTLTTADIGRWVVYSAHHGHRERGRIKSWSKQYVWSSFGAMVAGTITSSSPPHRHCRPTWISLTTSRFWTPPDEPAPYTIPKIAMALEPIDRRAVHETGRSTGCQTGKARGFNPERLR
jgi:hypothetical protein